MKTTPKTEHLANRIQEKSISCGEILPAYYYADVVQDIERDGSFRFTDEEIRLALDQGIDSAIDSMISNAYESPERRPGGELEEYAARLDALRPGSVRRKQIESLISGTYTQGSLN